jgi:hypothetical protein
VGSAVDNPTLAVIISRVPDRSAQWAPKAPAAGLASTWPSETEDPAGASFRQAEQDAENAPPFH